jgi:hypothetical protein
MSKPITRITVAVEVNLVLPEETDIHKAVAVIQKSFDYHMVSRAAKVTLLHRGPLPDAPALEPEAIPGLDLLG